MKTINEITFEDIEAMKKHHRKYEYNEAEAMEVVNLIRTYVDKHQSSCVTCGSNLREAKDKLNTFYLLHKDNMQKYALDNLKKEALESGAEVNGMKLNEDKIPVPVKHTQKKKSKRK